MMLSAMAIVGTALIMIAAILNGIKNTWKRILYADHRSIFRFMGFAFATCSGCLVVWLSGCLVVWLSGCLVVWLSGCLVNSVLARQLTYVKTIIPMQARMPVFVLVMICRRLEAY